MWKNTPGYYEGTEPYGLMVGSILFNLIIQPLELLFELVFALAYRFWEQPLFVLIAVSIVVNLVALPLYKRADAIQQEENERQAHMSRWVSHIKKTFTGDERYMMTAAYYRQQGYKSYYMLRGSFALLLQIPFFIAAYDYLSHLETLKTMSFWVFANLGEPDRLLHIGAMQVNILPLLMTMINIVSACIYLRDATTSQKIQTYALAAVFLVLLYNSPSGLVIYWTCNQIFSLLKNIFLKLVKSKKVLGICISLIGLAVFLVFLLTGIADEKGKVIFLIVLLCCCQIPLAVTLWKEYSRNKTGKPFKPVDFKIYLLTAIFLTIFMGIIIPLTVVSSSASEFVSYGNTPGLIVLNCACVMAGIFLVWCGVFYYLGTEKMRAVFAYILLAVAGVAAADFFLFGNNLGTLSNRLTFDNALEFETGEKILNLIVVAAVIVACCLLLKFLRKYMFYVMGVLCAAALGLCITMGAMTGASLEDAGINLHKTKVEDATPIFSLSRDGKNVVIVMLDRAIGSMVPYMFMEKPELKERFAGFTYYSNTLSFGGSTNLAIPALCGGYEYTPTEINNRPDDKLVDKHNEALRLMPTLFSENGYKITVTDPAYPNYSVKPDLSVFDGIDNLTAYTTIGQYECANVEPLYKAQKKIQNRNFIYYSFLKMMPEVIQPAVYDGGNYFSSSDYYYTTDAFLNSYAVLEALPNLTEYTDSSENTYLFLENETTHSPTALTYPDYGIGYVLKDSIYDQMDDYVINGRQMEKNSWNKVCHYKANMASFLKLADWFDQMRQEGVWDNTRIIIVSDHGRGLGTGGQFKELVQTEEFDAEKLNPVLMVKDFNSNEYKESGEFMTNADVPTIAFEGLIENPVNPFTGNPINMDEKFAHDQIITTSEHYRPNADHPTGKVFDTTDGEWWSVHDYIYDHDNWQFLAEGD